ncbi:hypothetical protein CEXT_780871 [Caerostris extrusa]|uniref:Uncharacterized protein n=1 Tax=Caerostris extrusa TaxID=172846 RepID=A0AAV4YDP8_CAEEX|nr:hypothetical protein CEXT_780871 [Caerostris extrusa]
MKTLFSAIKSEVNHSILSRGTCLQNMACLTCRARQATGAHVGSKCPENIYALLHSSDQLGAGVGLKKGDSAKAKKSSVIPPPPPLAAAGPVVFDLQLLWEVTTESQMEKEDSFIGREKNDEGT